MIDEREVEKGLQWLVDSYEEAGVLKAQFNSLERFTKVLRAKLMRDCNEATASAREAYAMSSDQMTTHLKGLKEAEEKWIAFNWKKESIIAKADAWRTQCSNTRHIK